MTAFDLTTAAYNGNRYDLSGDTGAERGCRWSADGTKFYAAGGNPTTVHQYAASTAWEVTSLSHTSSKALGAERQFPCFTSDGTRMFLYSQDSGFDTIYQWDLSTGWDITSATDSGNTLNTETEESDVRGLDVSADGAYIFILGPGSDRIHRYELATPSDLSTAGYSSNSMNIVTLTASSRKLDVTGDGLYLLFGQAAQDHSWVRRLTTAYDLTALDGSGGFSDDSFTADIGGDYDNVELSPDGSKVYLIRNDAWLYQLEMEIQSPRWAVGRALL